MQRRQFLAGVIIGAGSAALGRPVLADGAQLRMDVEVFNLKAHELPDKLQVPVKRLRREATLAGPEAEKLAELLRPLVGQQVWTLGRFTREAEDGIPVVVRLNRRRGDRNGYGFTLTPRVTDGEVAIEAELRTGKSRPDVCEPETRSYALRVSLGGYAAFWLTAPQPGESDSVVIARFHPSE